MVDDGDVEVRRSAPGERRLEVGVGVELVRGEGEDDSAHDLVGRPRERLLVALRPAPAVDDRRLGLVPAADGAEAAGELRVMFRLRRIDADDRPQVGAGAGRLALAQETVGEPPLELAVEGADLDRRGVGPMGDGLTPGGEEIGDREEGRGVIGIRLGPGAGVLEGLGRSVVDRGLDQAAMILAAARVRVASAAEVVDLGADARARGDVVGDPELRSAGDLRLAVAGAVAARAAAVAAACRRVVEGIVEDRLRRGHGGRLGARGALLGLGLLGGR